MRGFQGFDPRKGSINEQLDAYPRKRHAFQAKGMVLFLPRTGLVVVPYRMYSDGSWACVVVEGDATYRRDGYDLSVSEKEIESATELNSMDAFATLVGELRAEEAANRG